MKIDEYIEMMRAIGWSDGHINKLVNIYKNATLTEDGRIKVLAGDFNKKNLRKFETRPV